jgi:hypothetical protein
MTAGSFVFGANSYCTQEESKMSTSVNRPKIMERKKRTGQEKREYEAEVFPGAPPLQSLSRGIMEEDWLLATPPETYEPFPDDLKEKKKKPDCVAGAGHHDSLGRFSTKANAKSWSKTHPQGKGYDPDCNHGQRKSRGRFTRVRCGRELEGVPGKPSRTGKKAKYRCKDGAKVREQMASEALRSLPDDLGFALVSEVVSHVLNAQERSQTLTEGKREQVSQMCKSNGFYDLQFFLTLQDSIVRASEGKLGGD